MKVPHAVVIPFGVPLAGRGLGLGLAALVIRSHTSKGAGLRSRNFTAGARTSLPMRHRLRSRHSCRRLSGATLPANRRALSDWSSPVRSNRQARATGQSSSSPSMLATGGHWHGSMRSSMSPEPAHRSSWRSNACGRRCVEKLARCAHCKSSNGTRWRACFAPNAAHCTIPCAGDRTTASRRCFISAAPSTKRRPLAIRSNAGHPRA